MTRAFLRCTVVLDDRFHETCSRGTDDLFVDSPFGFDRNEEWHHGKMAAGDRVGDDR